MIYLSDVSAVVFLIYYGFTHTVYILFACALALFERHIGSYFVPSCLLSKFLVVRNNFLLFLYILQLAILNLLFFFMIKLFELNSPILFSLLLLFILLILRQDRQLQPFLSIAIGFYLIANAFFYWPHWPVVYRTKQEVFAGWINYTEVMLNKMMSTNKLKLILLVLLISRRETITLLLSVSLS